MNRGTGLLVLVGFTALLTLGVTHLPEAMAESEVFRVSKVEVEGIRYLSEEEALAAAALPPDLNLWDPTEGVADRLRTHPLVREARVRRKLPRTLVLELVEREPVALLPTPVLTPVDPDGRRLPVDPSLHVLDLPLLRAEQEDTGRGLSPTELRVLAGEVHRLERLDPLLHASLSDAGVGAWGEVVLRLAEPAVIMRYPPPLTPARLREGLLVLADALERHPDRMPEVVDLRFADQVVVRLTSPGGR